MSGPEGKVSDGDHKGPAIRPKTAAERAARESRLAEEMRANLLKRKAQQRAAQGDERPGRNPGDDQHS